MPVAYFVSFLFRDYDATMMLRRSFLPGASLIFMLRRESDRTFVAYFVSLLFRDYDAAA
jgi:hypothetical protein